MKRAQPHQTVEQDFVFNKELFVLVPLLGSAVAVTFDVGYFTGIDINLFTLFSLSEHIVFALQAFPAAVFLVMFTGLVVYSHKSLRRKVRLVFKGRLTASIFILLYILFLAVGIYFYSFYALTIGGFMASALLIVVIEAENLISRLIFSFAAALVVAYTLGYQLAVGYLRPNSIAQYFGVPKMTIETKGDHRIDARIIRSGDRGVLFYDLKSNRVTLVQWDEIKQVEVAK